MNNNLKKSNGKFRTENNDIIFSQKKVIKNLLIIQE